MVGSSGSECIASLAVESVERTETYLIRTVFSSKDSAAIQGHYRRILGEVVGILSRDVGEAGIERAVGCRKRSLDHLGEVGIGRKLKNTAYGEAFRKTFGSECGHLRFAFGSAGVDG